MGKYTLEDVSKIAGVSPKTVSRVINNEKYVKEETRRKILKIIKELDYQPNFSARSLVLRKTNTIGIIVGNLENPFYSRLTRGVVITAERKNYSVIVCESRFDKIIGEKYISMLLERGIDGLLIATLDISSNLVNRLNRKKIPFVLITTKLDIPNINYVMANDYHGGKLAAEYIIKLGHKNIAFLKGPDVFSSNERLSAYTDVMKKNNLNIKDYFITKELFDQKDGYEATLKLLTKYKDITAIIAINDHIAIGAMDAIRELGLSIPEDISIIGYDDINITKLLNVPLTTIHYPKYRCGVAATEVLISNLNKKSSKKGKKIILETTLVVRESCAPLKQKKH